MVTKRDMLKRFVFSDQKYFKQPENSVPRIQVVREGDGPDLTCSPKSEPEAMRVFSDDLNWLDKVNHTEKKPRYVPVPVLFGWAMRRRARFAWRLPTRQAFYRWNKESWGIGSLLCSALVLNQIRIGRDKGDGVCVWRLGQ